MNGSKMPSPEPTFLVVIVGPTAVGKTEFAIQIAEKLDGEIISADSRLLYRGMDIGTAKPSLEERRGIPHHLMDVAEPDEVWSVAKYQQEVLRAIEEINARGKLPFLVGGTGQFIRAVLEGWQIPQLNTDLTLRQTIDAWGQEIGARALHHKLEAIDPQAAALIEPNNLRRSVRAFEVIFSTGFRFSALRLKTTPNLRPLILGLTRSRSELYARVDQRIKEMLSKGLVDETRALLARNFSLNLPSLSAIGYREIIAFIRGEISLDEAEMLIQRNTRRFIRRQTNWFKPDDPTITWFDANNLDLLCVLELIQRARAKPGP